MVTVLYENSWKALKNFLRVCPNSVVSVLSKAEI